MNPTEGDRGLGGEAGADFFGIGGIAFGLAAEVFLSLGGGAGDDATGDVPDLDEVINDGGVVVDGIDAAALGDDGEVVEEVGVFAVVHEAAGHGDDAAEHAAEGEDAAAGVDFHDPAHHFGVEGFVAGFIAGDALADFCEVGVALGGDQFTDVAVGDFGGAFLEGGVDEAVVGVGVGLGVEAVGDEVVDGDFNGTHVDAAGEAEVGVEEVAVAVFLGGPAAEPDGPGGGVVAFVILGDVVEGDGIAGEGLFGDHVADEDDEEFVGDFAGALAEVVDLFVPVFGGEVGEVIGGLPGFVDVAEEVEVLADEGLHAPENFLVLGKEVIGHGNPDANTDIASGPHGINAACRG